MHFKILPISYGFISWIHDVEILKFSILKPFYQTLWSSLFCYTWPKKKRLAGILMFFARLSPNNLKLKIESFSLFNIAINLINLAAKAIVPEKQYIYFI